MAQRTGPACGGAVEDGFRAVCGTAPDRADARRVRTWT